MSDLLSGRVFKAAQAESDEEIASGSRLSPEVPVVQFQYDSDFAEASTPPDSDSDSDEEWSRFLNSLRAFQGTAGDLHTYQLAVSYGIAPDGLLH